MSVMKCLIGVVVVVDGSSAEAGVAVATVARSNAVLASGTATLGGSLMSAPRR